MLEKVVPQIGSIMSLLDHISNTFLYLSNGMVQM